MKLFHLIAVNHSPPEIREEYPSLAEYERTFSALSKRFETVCVTMPITKKRDNAWPLKKSNGT